MARTERVYIRMAPDDKNRLKRLTVWSNMSASQVVRSLVACATRDDFPGANEYRVIVFDRDTAPRMAREMRTWGYHYNQGVHALNRLAYYAQRGSLKDGEAERLLKKRTRISKKSALRRGGSRIPLTIWSDTPS